MKNIRWDDAGMALCYVLLGAIRASFGDFALAAVWLLMAGWWGHRAVRSWH